MLNALCVLQAIAERHQNNHDDGASGKVLLARNVTVCREKDVKLRFGQVEQFSILHCLPTDFIDRLDVVRRQ